ncbi:MAG: pilin [Patescibacteria group bacterium]
MKKKYFFIIFFLGLAGFLAKPAWAADCCQLETYSWRTVNGSPSYVSTDTSCAPASQDTSCADQSSGLGIAGEVRATPVTCETTPSCEDFVRCEISDRSGNMTKFASDSEASCKQRCVNAVASDSMSTGNAAIKAGDQSVVLDQDQSEVGWYTCRYNGTLIFTEQIEQLENKEIRWTCIQKYDKPTIDDDPKSNVICTDLLNPKDAKDKLPASTPFSTVEERCYARCKDPANPCVANLIPTLTCEEWFAKAAAGGSGPNPFDLNLRLGKQVELLNEFRDQGLKLSGLIGRVVRVAISILGTLSLIIFIYAGLRWMTSRGDSSAAESSRMMMMWAALGVIVILTSYAVVDFIFSAF